jgi:MFS family permease
MIKVPTKMSKKVVGMIFRLPKTKKLEGVVTSSGIGEPSIYHALVVIFLEFFAWGLLTSPMITVLNQTFPEQTFLMNGLIVGIKGILSFLSAPLVGALSDIWGRKFFLLITVFFTCAPIPLMKINTWWYFAMISISGVFAVTFSVVFAYVADVTDESDRSAAYGLVSATFAASLVMSPALGAYLEQVVIIYDYSHCYCFKLLIIKRQKVISIFKLFQTFTWCHRVNNVAMLRYASN